MKKSILLLVMLSGMAQTLMYGMEEDNHNNTPQDQNLPQPIVPSVPNHFVEREEFIAFSNETNRRHEQICNHLNNISANSLVQDPIVQKNIKPFVKKFKRDVRRIVVDDEGFLPSFPDARIANQKPSKYYLRLHEALEESNDNLDQALKIKENFEDQIQNVLVMKDVTGVLAFESTVGAAHSASIMPMLEKFPCEVIDQNAARKSFVEYCKTKGKQRAIFSGLGTLLCSSAAWFAHYSPHRLNGLLFSWFGKRSVNSSTSAIIGGITAVTGAFAFYKFIGSMGVYREASNIDIKNQDQVEQFTSKTLVKSPFSTSTFVENHFAQKSAKPQGENIPTPAVNIKNGSFQDVLQKITTLQTEVKAKEGLFFKKVV